MSQAKPITTQMEINALPIIPMPFRQGEFSPARPLTPFFFFFFYPQYGIKKKEEEKPAEVDDFAAGSLNRRKKTPEEIAAENEAAEQDDLTRLRNTIETQVNELKSSIEGKCVLQPANTRSSSGLPGACSEARGHKSTTLDELRRR
ncbi:hypothetical protein HPB48_014168 [Haemaphysalis longicornis]|uniref:Complexin n=1 Tax=Haemaphysalis longicornis TaxID=44386 RepID=A0A9J6FJ12_HAELO|nr:hypothetical protein HPB48_014168 [Haemaphysalis longicornis]